MSPRAASAGIALLGLGLVLADVCAAAPTPGPAAIADTDVSPAPGPAPPDPRQLEELRSRIRFDRYDADSRRRLAELLEGTEDIELRREASDALREALLVENGDPDLWMRFARLQERRGFHQDAEIGYREALRLAPDRWDLWESVAHHEFLRFQRQLLWSHFEASAAATERALSLRPDYSPALERGLRIALIRGDGHSVDSLCTAWHAVAPNDPWPILVRGMLEADAGAWDLAERSFEAGLARLSEEERRPFFRLDRVDPREEEHRRESPDTLRYFQDYWRWRDPTPADPVNPRLVEHYRRMIQAELLFALDDLGVRGWEHAPGEMLVRYGLPRWWTFLRGLARVEEYRVNPAMSAPTIEVNFGDGSVQRPLLFVDYNLNGRYYSPIEGFPHADELDMVAVPSAYTPPFEAPERGQDVEVWRFQDGAGRGRLEVGIALLPQEWPPEVLASPHRLASRVSVYDSVWSQGDARIVSWAPFAKDPLGRLIARLELEGGADSLILGLETVDRQKSARAEGYSTVPPRAAAHGDLLLSDLAFLSGVDFSAPAGAYGWGYGSGLPNPGHVYRSGDPVGIAFEAYGLGETEGDCRARIHVSVSKETRAGLLRILLGSGARGEAELVFEATEPGSVLHQLLALELPPLDPGHYVLRVRVEDLAASRSAEMSGDFRIVETGSTP